MASKVYVCKKCGSRRSGKYLGFFGKDEITNDVCNQCADTYQSGSFDYSPPQDCNSGSCINRFLEPGEKKQADTRYVCTCCGDWEGHGSRVQSHVCGKCLQLPKKDRQPRGFKALPNTQLNLTTINSAKRPFCCVNCGVYIPPGVEVYSFLFNNTDKTHIFGEQTLGFVCLDCGRNGAVLEANHYVGMMDAGTSGINYFE